MKILTAFLLLVPACVNYTGTTAASVEALKLRGDTLPEIAHVTDMKIAGDTLYFVYETPDSYGQRFLRSAVIDEENRLLSSGPEAGKRDNGYYQTDMPYPFVSSDGQIKVIGQDTGELFSIADGTTLSRDRQYLFSGNAAVPFPISSYVQDVFQLFPDSYLFRGRRPRGGSQYVFASREHGARIDSLCSINISPDLPSWTVNTGEMAFSAKDSCIVFAYRLHPVIEFYNLVGSKTASVAVAGQTFDRATISEADFEDLNPLHFVDLTQSGGYVYALYWGYRYSDTGRHGSRIYKINPNGKTAAEYSLPIKALNIAAGSRGTLIAWTGTAFYLVTLNY